MMNNAIHELDLDENYLDRCQTAELCGVSWKTVKNWATSGKLKTYYSRNGTRSWHPLSDIKAFLIERNRKVLRVIGVGE